MAVKYYAMINMPGYMPDEPPDYYDTKAEALKALYDAVERDAENAEIDESKMRDAIEHLASHHYVYFNHYYYGIQEG
jgi:hypothetical protein